MYHIDSDALRRNKLFNDTFEKTMETLLANAEGASLTDNESRLVNLYSRTILQSFKDELFKHSEIKN